MTRLRRHTIAVLTILAASALGTGARPAAAASLDKAGRCGQLFSTQASAAATAMPNFVRYLWVATKTTKTEIDVNLVVYGKTSALIYPGFACTVGADNTLTVKSPITLGN